MSNTRFLYRFFVKDALNGIADKPFLRKKSGRVILGTVIVGAYAAYIFFNVKSVADMGIKAGDVNDSLLNLTLSSFVNVEIIISTFLFVFSQMSTSITNRALFFAKKLPFKNKEVSRAHALFKFTLAATVYQLFFLLIMALCRIMADSIAQCLMFIAIIQLVFIVTYGTWNILLHIATRFLRNRRVPAVFCIILLILASIHFYKTRFAVDFYFGRLAIRYDNLIILFLVAAVVFSAIVIAVHLLANFSEAVVFKPKFISVPFPGPIRAVWQIKSVLRTPTARTSFLGFLIISAISCWSSSSISDGLQDTIVQFYPILGIIFANYCDSTLDMRVMNLHYGITPVKEWLQLMILFLIFMIPAGIAGFHAEHSLRIYFFGLCVCCMAVLIGFIFPRSKGGMNEFASSFVFMLLLAVVITLVKTDKIIFAASAVFSVIVYLFINADKQLSKTNE